MDNNLIENEELMKQKGVQARKYLESHIFIGLTNLNDGFDVESIFYFSETDFETILERVEERGIAIYGIEAWFDGDSFGGVKTFEDFGREANDPDWYKTAFADFKKEGSYIYNASFKVPEELLED